ncbi:sodium-dependent transporter [Polycladidibacter hongkongensis]|uniref:sodium-dependent transporter n=1 Tax=Polycladidibacter hongkongensis TaxID=1647556 RepID=UPI0008328286|nr:sodium-dependent transporter [Pseudovibrio hongkongensis]
MQREQWGSRFGFIMAAAGSAVGLGNVWKFPYLVGENGGSAFLIIYIAFMATIGIGLMMAEIGIGRYSQMNPVGAFRKIAGRGWSWAGMLGVITAIIIMSYYSVVGGWTIAYFIDTLSGAVVGGTPDELGSKFGALVGDTTRPIIYDVIFLGLTLAVVIAGVSSGIEKAVKVLMPLLFIMLIVLVARSVTLEGASAGIDFLLSPKWDEVGMGTISAALGQSFFSLSLGMGALVTYGSYLNKNDNIRSSASWVCFLDTAVAVLAGFLVMPAVFAFGFNPGAGPGLTFITLPAVFSGMWGGQLFQAFFFFMLFVAAITSSISLVAIPVSYLSEQFHMSRVKATLLVGAIVFVVSIPCSLSLGIWSDYTLFGYGVLDLLSNTVDWYLLPIGGIAVAVCAGWFAYDKIAAELTNHGELPFPLLGAWKFIMRIVAPIAITWVLVGPFLT